MAPNDNLRDVCHAHLFQYGGDIIAEISPGTPKSLHLEKGFTCFRRHRPHRRGVAIAYLIIPSNIYYFIRRACGDFGERRAMRIVLKRHRCFIETSSSISAAPDSSGEAIIAATENDGIRPKFHKRRDRSS